MHYTHADGLNLRLADPVAHTLALAALRLPGLHHLHTTRQDP
jgi:hypothetical protein